MTRSLRDRLVALLPALVAVGAFALLSGIPSCHDLRAARERIRNAGDPEDHAVETITLRRRISDARAELTALRSDAVREGAGGTAALPGATPAAALGETHRRILSHGARILHVSPSADTSGAASHASDEPLRLLRLQTGRELRAWEVAIEAPWDAAQALLDELAGTAPDTPNDAPLVLSLTLRPAMGEGRPACWLLSLRQ